MKSRPRLTLITSAASDDDVGTLPEGIVEVTDKRERELYNCLAAILQSRHLTADLSWDVIRMDDQQLFLDIGDVETGQPYYRLEPWLPKAAIELGRWSFATVRMRACFTRIPWRLSRSSR